MRPSIGEHADYPLTTQTLQDILQGFLKDFAAFADNSGDCWPRDIEEPHAIRLLDTTFFENYDLKRTSAHCSLLLLGLPGYAKPKGVAFRMQKTGGVTRVPVDLEWLCLA
jgi:hypothetical protein